MSFPVCIESAETSYDQCAAFEDRGHTECDTWRSECCDWWPCNWFCEIVSWFCSAWVWIANIVCVLWETITLVVCLVWSVVEIVLAPIGALIELIKSIPFIGRLIDTILGVVTEIVWRLVRLPEALASLTGTESTLTVRLCAIVLRHPPSGGTLSGYPASPFDATRDLSRDDIEQMVGTANRLWLDSANIQVVLENVTFLQEEAPEEAANTNCGAAAFGDHLAIAGSYYQFAAATRACPAGAIGRTIGFNAWIIVVFPLSLSGNCRGNALGPLTDYMLVGPNAGANTLAHELGHKLSLGHHGDVTNLMTGAGTTPASTTLEWWQRVWARGSKYASHF